MNRIKMITAGMATIACVGLAVPASADTPAAPTSAAGKTILRVDSAQASWPMYSAPHSDTYWVGALRSGEWYEYWGYRDMPDGRWCHIVDTAGYGGEHYADTAAWVRGIC
ncbi:hypothetical protein AB0M80_41420 [Amycolatopsis sp. NPDC051045]|uniref:hypothetical protein n=1 Tax=Amycolatopsis sp. NPDC051045 TaxID=3156922 RepID=UPI00343B2BE3